MSTATAPGTTPRGTSGEKEASAWVRGMFGRIAPRYDLVNRVLAFNLDRRWRVETVRRVGDVLKRPGARALDLCCGTGDVLAVLSEAASGPVFGTDFCHPMLLAAGVKMARRRLPARLFEADALRLPLADESMDVITVAFGFRNLANYRHGLAEMHRTLRPGGVAAILEFSQPDASLFARLYGFYSRHLMPALGGVISGARDAYEYLPESIQKFPDAPQLAENMKEVGFSSVEFVRMAASIVALHLGTK